MKMTVFWVVAPCSLVEFINASEVIAVFINSIIVLMMEAASTSETSGNFYQTTRRNNPKDSHLLSRYYFRIRMERLRKRKINLISGNPTHILTGYHPYTSLEH
jgi:hypothetical protein